MMKGSKDWHSSTDCPWPPLPEIDDRATAHANDVLRSARGQIEKTITAGKKLTQADCEEVVAAVEASAAVRDLAV